VVHVTDIIFKRLNIAEVVRFSSVKFIDFLFHSTSFGDEILDYQVHVLVGPLEVNDLGVHAGNLLFHFGDFLFSWPDVSLEFLNFVI
jgi:hypothetical protein